MPENIHKTVYRFIRNIFFRFDLEFIHGVVSVFLEFTGLFFNISLRNNQGYRFCNQNLANPIGLAAGFDKNGNLVNGLSLLHFGLVETGTFTKSAQSGNPLPRLFRIPSHQALFNRMGFNNPGIEKGIENLRKARYPFAVSIGKSKETSVDKAAEDYVSILRVIELPENRDVKNRIVYIAINISSPNTPGLRLLQNKTYIRNLIAECRKESNLPLFVKFSPDFSNMREFNSTLTAAVKAGINGVIVTNTTSDQGITGCVPPEIRNNGGGLSGQPLTKKSEEYLKAAMKICGTNIPVISSGGIMNLEDVWKRLESGASLVQLYTGFIYNGPWFVQECIKYINFKIQQNGFTNFNEYRQQFLKKK